MSHIIEPSEIKAIVHSKPVLTSPEEINSEFALIERSDYKHLHHIIELTEQLQRYCEEQDLPIFNHPHTLNIMIRNLT